MKISVFGSSMGRTYASSLYPKSVMIRRHRHHFAQLKAFNKHPRRFWTGI